MEFVQKLCSGHSAAVGVDAETDKQTATTTRTKSNRITLEEVTARPGLEVGGTVLRLFEIPALDMKTEMLSLQRKQHV